jgi:hypothetical protein
MRRKINRLSAYPSFVHLSRHFHVFYAILANASLFTIHFFDTSEKVC